MVSHGTTTLRRQPLLGALLLLILSALALLGASSIIRSVADRPDVYTSYMTRQCVKVVNADGSPGDCSKLPERYNNIWVE